MKDNMDLIAEVINPSPERREWIDSLQPGSPAAWLVVSCTYKDEGTTCGDAGTDGIESGGQIFVDGVYRKNGNTTIFLVQPDSESHEDFMARKYRVELTSNFPWRRLTAGQLDAVLKYAKEKLERNEALGVKPVSRFDG